MHEKVPMKVPSPTETNIFSAQLCIFKRKKESCWEVGLMIGEDKVIIDRDFNLVPAPIWDYTNHPNHGYSLFNVPEKVKA